MYSNSSVGSSCGWVELLVSVDEAFPLRRDGAAEPGKILPGSVLDLARTQNWLCAAPPPTEPWPPRALAVPEPVTATRTTKQSWMTICRVTGRHVTVQLPTALSDAAARIPTDPDPDLNCLDLPTDWHTRSASRS